MPVFNNLNDLFKYIQKNITESLEDNVFEEVRDVEQKHIDSDVYNVYSPTSYVRRDIVGGLIADDNIQKEMIDDNTLFVRNMTPPKGKNDQFDNGELSEWVEYGKVKNLSNDDNAPWTRARPFTQNTIAELRMTGRHVYALKKGLNKRGIQTK